LGHLFALLLGLELGIESCCPFWIIDRSAIARPRFI
jgi:hypothetical protein